jgi:NitT/TauT family transport system permease protein
VNAVTTVKNTTSRGSATDGSRRGLRRAKAANSSSRRKLLAARIGVLVVAVCLWQMIAGRFISDFYLPEPTQVWTELKGWASDGSLWQNSVATIVPAIKGFLIGSVIALALGYTLAMAKFVAAVLEPYISAMYGVPIVALIPLLILWFGIGPSLAVAAAALVTFFQMFYNAYYGIKDVNQGLIDQVSIAGGSKLDIALRVRLPSALVWVVAGMKVAVPHALVAVVVTEFLAGSRGLGYLLASNANQFNSAGTFAAVVMLATISFTIDRLMFVLTRRALMWKESGGR